MSITTTLSTGTTTATVTTGPHQHRDPFDLIGLAVLNIGWYLIIGAGVAIHCAILFPIVSGPVLIAVAVGVMFGWPIGAATALLAALALAWFRRTCPDLFSRWVTDRARVRFFTWWRYTRRWARMMAACHLTITTEDRRVVKPRLLAVEIGKATDRVRLKMLPGQAPADYDHRTDNLAHAFGVEQCHATIVGPATVELLFRHGDALAETVLLPRVDQWTKPEGGMA
jgi:hypothetical protein